MAVTDGSGSPKKGCAGAYSFYQRNGQTIMRIADRDTSNPGRTPKAMASRTKMGNVVAAWRTMKNELKGCFERQRPGQTDYSIFLSANLEGARVFLSQEEVKASVCVADTFTVSQGTLQPVIQVEEREALMLSDIAFGPGPLDPEIPFGSFANNIVRYNGGAFHFGDTLCFVRLTQVDNGGTAGIQCLCHATKLVLERNLRRSLRHVIEDCGGWDGFQPSEGRLAAERRENSLVAWMRLRPAGHGMVLATTQNLMGTNTLLERFTSWEHREEAIHSYGTLKDTGFLNPERYQPYEEEEYPELNNQ